MSYYNFVYIFITYFLKMNHLYYNVIETFLLSIVLTRYAIFYDSQPVASLDLFFEKHQ